MVQIDKQVMPSTAITHRPPNTPLQTAVRACDTCSSQKRRCDRLLPACGSCMKKQRRCHYPHVPDEYAQRVESLQQSFEQLRRRHFQTGSVPRLIDDGFSYPVPKKWYFSALLFYRKNSFIPVTHLYPNTIANNLHTSWLQTALSDACLFHATIFSMSSFMDILQGADDNPVTNYHKMETIRLVQAAISNSHRNGLSDTIIAATIYLLYFAGVNGYKDEYQSHSAGLDAMIQFRGFEELRRNTVLGWYLVARHIWVGFIFDMDTAFPLPPLGPRHSIGCYTSLLATAVQKQLERPPESRLPVSILEILLTLNHMCTGLVEPVNYPGHNTPHHLLESVYRITPNETETNARECCLIAATIYWRTMTEGKASSQDRNQDDACRLREAIQRADDLFWFRLGPEVWRWVLMTGAVASGSPSQRAWFVARCFPLSAVLESEEVETFLVGADHLLWLFNH